MKCLVCKLGDVGEEDSYEICSVCGRENESWGMGDEEFGGANYFTVNDHRELWELSGSKIWNGRGLNSIDRLAAFIEEDFGINGFKKSNKEYREVVEECKRLLSQADFNITTDIERRVHENPTTPSALFWS